MSLPLGLSDISFQDAPPQEETLSFAPSNAPAIPPPEVVQTRAEKTHAGLGQQSPGVENIKQMIFAGGEGDLRAQTSKNADLSFEAGQRKLVARAAADEGRALSDDEVKALYEFSATKFQNDPKSILEKIYANKFISDVTNSSDKTRNPAVQGDMPVETSIASGIKQRVEFFQTGLESAHQEHQNDSWLTWGKNLIVEAIPFLPWWRQAQALSERPNHNSLLAGTTMRENVQYLWSLPFDQAKAEYAKAMEYFRKSGNSEDRLAFAQAMVSYGTSDEYLANSMSLADYTTAGLPILKFIGKFGKEAAPAVKAAEAAVSKVETPTPIPGSQKLLEYQGSNKFTKQPDLFGEQPAQGEFGFYGSMGGSTKPIPMNRGSQKVYRGPDGRMHSTVPDEATPVSPTGLFRDDQGRFNFATTSMKQGELPLDAVPHQGSLSLEPPAFKPQPLPEVPATKAVEEVRRTYASAIQAAEGPKIAAPDVILGAAGEVRAASQQGALKRILNPLGIGNSDVLREVPTFANPVGFLQDSKVISRARAQALVPHLQDAIDSLVTRFSQAARPSRLSAEQLAVANKMAEASLQKEYGKRFGDAVLDISYIPAEKHPSNIDTVLMKIGTPDGALFDTPEKAALFRDTYKLGKQEALITPQGGKYYLSIPKHIDETADAVRDVIRSSADRTNNSIMNQLLGRLRSAEDLFGLFQRENRQIAVHAPQEIRKAIREFIETNIESLPKASRRAVEDILRENRDMPSLTNPKERGRWYDTAAEFEQAFSARHSRMPNEQEILAYDQFKRLSDFDWLMRNVAVYRDKARQGVESFRYHFADEAGQSSSPWFEGKRHDSMPWSVGNKADQDAGIWLYDSSTGQGKFYYKYSMTKEERELIDHLTTEKGYRVVQVFDPKQHSLNGIAKTAAGEDLRDQVNYIVTNTWEKGGLSWKQVDYRPGGHVIYPHEWFVAQPVIQMGRLAKATYLGDNNILNIRTQAEAKKWAEAIDQGRQLLKQGRLDELNTHIDTKLPHTREEFMDLFQRSDSPLSLDHPVTFKQSGFNTLSSDAMLKGDYKNLINGTRNVHDLSNFMDKSFLMDRDNILSGVVEKGGIKRLGAAEQLDPYIALNQAMGQGLRNVWMNDYKIGAVEHWVKEFEHVMNPSDAALFKHPLFFLYNPQWANVSAAAGADLAAAKAAQRAIVNFIGTKSELGAALDTVKMRALNSVYGIAGQGKMLDIALATTADPVSFLRGVAFHSKLGMFNPVQFFVQAQSMAHSIAVAGPTHGLPGFAAAPLIRWLGHNPAQLETVAGVASKLGWTKPQFIEMYETLKKTGLYQVAGEAALRDDAFDPHLFRSTFGRYVLDAGPMFFNEGERMTRMTAFATAFREFKAADATAKIGNREIGAIMRRADDLSVNMTRASNAAWQTGVWSVPFQFFSYNARVMEQLLGSRLTGLEKTRMMATYSAMYGLPIGVGAAVGGVFPVYDSIKEEAFKRGINLNEGWTKIATEGLMAQLSEWMTGKQSNVAQRFGPGNQQTIKDVITGDKPFSDAMFGASGTIVKDFVKASYPFFHSAASVVLDNGEYPLMSSDWMSLFRNFSTVDVGAKVFGALSYGKWLTKTGTNVTSADNMDAALTLLGLTPRSASDTFLWQKALRSQKDGQASYEKEALEQYRRGLEAGSNGDFEAMKMYHIRAKAAIEAGEFSFQDRNRLYHQMVGQNQSLSEKVKWDAFRHAPGTKAQDIYNNFIKK